MTRNQEHIYVVVWDEGIVRHKRGALAVFDKDTEAVDKLVEMRTKYPREEYHLMEVVDITLEEVKVRRDGTIAH